MLPSAPFGSTGHQSSRVIFGAAAPVDAPSAADMDADVSRFGVTPLFVAGVLEDVG